MGDSLQQEGISAEMIDLRSIKPWDVECVVNSVAKTGRLVIADEAWRTCGIAGEIAATVGNQAFTSLRAPIRRVCLPDLPAAASPVLEQAYYPDASDVVRAIRETLAFDRNCEEGRVAAIFLDC